MNKILHLLPSKIKSKSDFIEKLRVDDSFMLATAIGLKKEINEDVVGICLDKVFKKVFSYGAEDNASLIVFRKR